MERYWTRIALGAVVVFAIGLVVMRVGRSAATEVRETVETARTITIPLPFIPFTFEGDRLGTLRSLRVERDLPNRVSGLELSVEADDSVIDSRLGECALTADDMDNIDETTTFVCAPEADSAGGVEFVPFGRIVFQPSGRSRTLVLPAALVAEWRSHDGPHDLQAAEAASEAANAALEAAEAQAEAAAMAGTIARIHADSTGAMIRIRGKDGRDLVVLDADSDGARLVVRDSNGREVVNLRADSSSADVIVNDAGESKREQTHRP